MHRKIFKILKDSRLSEWRTIKNIAHLKFQILRKYENYLWARYNGGIIELSEFKMYVDPRENVVSKAIFLDKTWEPFESKLFCRSISKGDIVVDIGAHIGWYSLLASRHVGKNGVVYAFEPEPRSFNILLMNIQLNGVTNIVPINKALSDSSGSQLLYINLYKEGPSNYQMWPVSDEESILVDVVTLDEYLEHKHVDIIKIDVEGYEVKVLRGMERILSENPELIIFSEYWPEGLRRAGASSEEYIDIISKHGFSIRKIEDGKLISYREALNLNKGTNFLLTKSH